MNTQTTGPLPHLGEDELLRFIDNEGDDAWRAGRQRHLAACQACTRELDLLAADADLVRTWVDAAAFEADLPPAAAGGRVPHRTGNERRRHVMASPWLRAAAVLLLMAAPVVAVPALREWVVDSIIGDGATPGAATLAVPESAGEAAIIRFVPAAGPFIVSVDAAQEDGTLTLRVDADAGQAALETLPYPGGASVEPVISEGSLRLRNSPAAAASYTLTLPASVTRVVVTVDGVPVADLDTTALAGGVTLPLQSP
ncbi:MAG TPA: hypothetical protein VK929_04760 [Longimicrobiales bacterium]|nr:hypothetical protein [Longimicrobiales bacterium]